MIRPRASSVKQILNYTLITLFKINMRRVNYTYSHRKNPLPQGKSVNHHSHNYTDVIKNVF